MNARYASAMLLLAAAAGCWTAARPDPASPSRAAAKAPPWEKTGGVSLIVRFDSRSAKILSAKPTSRPPSLVALHGPWVTAKTSPSYPVGTQELLLAAYRRDGTLVRTLAWPSRAIVFHDEADPLRKGGIRGRARAPREDQRFLDLPMAADARYLVFFRSAIVPSGKLPPISFDENPCIFRAPRREPPPAPIADRPPIVVSFLAAYSLWPFPGGGDPGSAPPGIDPPVPPEGFEPPVPDLGRYGISRDCISHLPNVEPGVKIPCALPNGTFQDFQSRTPGADPAHSFDVVILGDGFTSTTEFDKWASKVETALVGGGQSNQPGVEPFASLSDMINVHKVRTVSLEKGITHCWSDYENPCADRTVKTYFGVEGMWTDPTGERGGPGYFGTPNLCLVDQAVEKVAPRDQIELVIVLANCSRYGGDADMLNRIVYLPVFDDTYTYEKFEDLVAHEAAHGTALLGEEYVACLSPDLLWTFPNVATDRDVASDSVWWKTLARPEEIQSGKFAAVHKCGDPFDCACEPDLTPPERRGMLGLFWGAQFGTCECPPDATDCPQSYWCTSSCDYYRPMKTCKMRELRDANGGAVPFCRACEFKLREAILKATTAP